MKLLKVLLLVCAIGLIALFLPSFPQPPFVLAQTNTFCASNLACTVTGTWGFTGPVTTQVFNNVRYADNFAGADCGAKINAASTSGGINTLIIVTSPTTCPSPITTALSLAVATKLQFGPGTWRWNTYNTFNQALTWIEGAGNGQTEFDLGLATGDWGTVTANTFRMKNIFFSAGAGVTRTAGSVLNIQAQGGNVENVIISDCWNGFTSTTASSNQWVFKNIGIQSAGGNWNNLFQIGPIASSTITGWEINGIIGTVANSVTNGPLILLDSGTDGPDFWALNFGTSGSTVNTQPAIKLQNTSTAQDPSWARFTNTYVECGTNASLLACIQIVHAKDFSYVNSYEASSTNGVLISGGAGIRFVSSVFLNNRQSAFIINGGTSVLISDNDISDNGQQTTNTYDAISVAANVNDFRIVNNRIGNQLNLSGNLSHNGVNVAAGTSTNYEITGNVYGTLGNTFVNDLGTGATKMTLDPGYSGSQFNQSITFANQTTSILATGPSLFKSIRGTQTISDQGTACTNGELALSAGWQSTGSATVTAVAGNGQTCSWTITTGTTTAANPTVTDTLTNALPNATTVCWMIVNGGTHTPVVGAGTSDAFRQTTLSATAPVFTYQETPTAGGTTYFVTRGCGP